MKGNGPEKEVIHSGHFMSTVVHEEPNPSIVSPNYITLTYYFNLCYKLFYINYIIK